MILNDAEIRRLALLGMISPYDDAQLRPGVISWGVSSFGYDIRKVFDLDGGHNNLNLSTEQKFHLGNQRRNYLADCGGKPIIDPKETGWHCLFDDVEADSVVIPPNSFLLGESVEWLDIPRDVLAVCVGKSTLARAGLIVNITPLEPEWNGVITLEVSNTTPLPAKLYANEGISQVLFFRGEYCERSYSDKKGRYQNQTGLTMPSVRREP